MDRAVGEKASTMESPGPDWYPLSPESLGNPIDEDTEMLRRCPVAYSTDFGGFYALFRYADIVEVARDPATFSSVPSIGLVTPHPDEAPSLPLQSDPPDHREYRAIVAPLFRASRLE